MRIILHKRFEKKYARTSRPVRERFKTRRNLFLANPAHPLLNNHSLSGDRVGQWSFNVTGDWRALYVFADAETIIFIDLDTHSNLYG